MSEENEEASVVVAGGGRGASCCEVSSKGETEEWADHIEPCGYR